MEVGGGNRERLAIGRYVDGGGDKERLSGGIGAVLGRY